MFNCGLYLNCLIGIYFIVLIFVVGFGWVILIFLIVLKLIRINLLFDFFLIKLVGLIFWWIIWFLCINIKIFNIFIRILIMGILDKGLLGNILWFKDLLGIKDWIK